MKRVLFEVALVGVGVALGAAIVVPQAGSYQSDPWGRRGPCAGEMVRECATTPSPEDATRVRPDDAWHRDKTGHIVCRPSAVYCRPLMTLVRVLPTAPIGAWMSGGH
ncbi:hypothetical protein NDR87_16260 [Nocardia sp. CDC159]|uniref:Uncharacterized protein n=1 Tax=Nocardia pulmonis TaxID=2951408 RepID=A0A9X2E753_9NOCA|nr:MULTISPECIES: hypothetical protein [Nocardia]MCM6775352.1 hypothetical protein [Nocardia pulmonis]MCM6787914.1 hypothetical protein [Nocardia sp. CDC159]